MVGPFGPDQVSRSVTADSHQAEGNGAVVVEHHGEDRRP